MGSPVSVNPRPSPRATAIRDVLVALPLDQRTFRCVPLSWQSELSQASCRNPFNEGTRACFKALYYIPGATVCGSGGRNIHDPPQPRALDNFVTPIVGFIWDDNTGKQSL